MLGAALRIVEAPKSHIAPRQRRPRTSRIDRVEAKRILDRSAGRKDAYTLEEAEQMLSGLRSLLSAIKLIDPSDFPGI